MKSQTATYRGKQELEGGRGAGEDQQMSAPVDALTAVPRCPIVSGRSYDPMDPEQAGNQYPWLSAAQKQAPVFYMPDYDMWCVTRYEDVLRIVRDVEHFSSRGVIPNDLHPDVAELLPAGHPFSRALVNSDPPEHTRRRKAMQRAFTPKAIATWTPRVHQLANELIDEFIGRGECNLVSDFAIKLSLQVVALLVGIPPEKASEYHSLSLRQLTVSASGPITASQRRVTAERTSSFVSYLKELLEQRRDEPKDDLVSYLVNAATRPGDPALTIDEMVSALMNVIGASIGNTVTGIALMFRELLRGGQWQAVRRSPALVSSCVEESLRWHDPAQAVLRITTRPVTIAGQDIPAGTKVYAHYGAAQRDPRMFSDPDRFDIERSDLGRHFALGKGAHTCLGAPMARLEMQESLRCFMERIPELRLVGDGEPTWIPDFVGAQVVELLLEWDT